MGLSLLIILSLFFGYVFTEHYKTEIKKLQTEVDALQQKLYNERKQLQIEKELFVKAVKESLL